MSIEKAEELEYAPLGGNVTLDQIIHAYVDSLLDERPMTNPLFESVVHVRDQGWLHLKFGVEYTWSVDMPEAGRKAMEAAGFVEFKGEQA